MYVYNCHATTNDDNSINVNNGRKKVVMVKIKIEIAIKFLLPKFVPKSK